MNGISVDILVLLIKGIPEGFLVALAIHVITGTKVEWKKYLLLSGIYILATYLIRFLPITLGINTVLSLFVLIFAFQIVHRAALSQVIRAVIASVIILVMIAFSEVLNVLLLTAMYGREPAEKLFTSPDGFTRALYSTPSTIFFALMVVAGYFVMRAVAKRKALKAAQADTPPQEPQA